jgi:DNA ligase-1
VKRLAHALDAIRLSRSRIGKEEALAAALAEIARDPGGNSAIELATAARLAAGRTLAIGDGRTLGAGGSIMTETACARTGYSAEIVWACARRTGDLGEAFALLVARDPAAYARPGLSLVEVAELFDVLASTGNRLVKRRRLDAAFQKATPLETKYLAKAILGSLRVGAQGGVLEAAIGRAFAVDPDELRRAAALVTDPGELAVLARDDRLDEARLEIGRPVAYMLATPLETIATPLDAAMHVIEDKIDGVRAQIHKRDHEVAIFARGLERVTEAFPDVVDLLRFVKGSFALDGELVAMGPSGRVRPFQALQARLRRSTPTRALIEATPVAFIAYDILSDGQRDLLALPWTERRAALEELHRTRDATGTAFVVNGARPALEQSHGAPIPLTEVLDVSFAAARARGHEGLVLKKVDAPYDAGRRGQAWIKVKRAFATLDVVVTAVEEGHGKRAGVLSDYTFAVWRGEGDARETVNVGKAYSGLTDVEIEQLGRRFVKMTTERFGRVRAVAPEIVLEVAFDGIQRSTRHKSGFALRFPRILRIRDDKVAADADTLATVEALFASQVETGHREEPPVLLPAGTTPRPKKIRGRANVAQLSLFGDLASNPANTKKDEAPPGK